MKRTLRMVTIFHLFILLISCSKKESQSGSGSLTGTWLSTNTQYQSFSNGVMTKDTTYVSGQTILTLNPDSSFTGERNGNDWSGTFSTFGDTLKMTIKRSASTGIEIANYRLNNNNLALIYPGSDSSSTFLYTLNFIRK